MIGLQIWGWLVRPALYRKLRCTFQCLFLYRLYGVRCVWRFRNPTAELWSWSRATYINYMTSGLVRNHVTWYDYLDDSKCTWSLWCSRRGIHLKFSGGIVHVYLKSSRSYFPPFTSSVHFLVVIKTKQLLKCTNGIATYALRAKWSFICRAFKGVFLLSIYIRVDNNTIDRPSERLVDCSSCL